MYIAITKGNKRKLLQQFLLRDKKKKKQMQYGKSKNVQESEPLLQDQDMSLASFDDLVESDDDVEKRDREAQRKANYWNNTFVGILIAILTICEVFTGVKTVVFEFEGDMYIFKEVAMSSLVLWMSGELWLAREIISALTREAGHFYPQLHSHPLYYDDTCKGHRCDLCGARSLREAYRCTACDFDMCFRCVSRNNKTSAEGVLRSDKGAKEEKDISNWEYMKKAMTFAKAHVFLIMIAFIFLLTASVPVLLLPNYQGIVLDKVIHGDREGFKHNVIVFVILSATVGFCGGIRNLCFSVVGQKMLNDVQHKLFTAMIKQDIAFFDGIASGNLTSRLWNDASAMISPINTVLTTLLSSSIQLVGGLFMCLYTSWRLSVLAFTTIGPITLMYRIYSKWSRTINKEIWASLSDANALATEAISNIRTVRAFSQEPNEDKKYHQSIGEALRKGILDSWAGAGTFALTSYMDQAVGVLLLCYGGSVVLDDPDMLSIGKLITFQLYWNMINSSYQSLTGVVSSFTRAGGAAQRVMSLLDNMPDIDPSQGEPVKNIKGDITLEDVEFFYQMRPDQQILKGINLTIAAGQVCALVGKSGGGKSTLIHMLMRFYDPKKGRILLDGKDLTTLNPIDYRRNLGIVAQETQLFNMTIEENIAYGVDHYTQDQLYDAAKLANCHDFIVTFDEGYQTRVGEHGTRLSGGQKQRIALARVFLRRPKLLFLDEATSSLDAESEALVQEAIDKLIRIGNCTVVLVAHRLSTVINADKIAVVDSGTIAEEGTHQQLLEKGGIYAKLVKRQVQKMQNTLEQSKDPKEQQSADVIDNLITDEKGT